MCVSLARHGSGAAKGARPHAVVVGAELEQLAAADVEPVPDVPPLARRELARLRQLRRVRLREPRRALRLRSHGPSWGCGSV